MRHSSARLVAAIALLLLTLLHLDFWREQRVAFVLGWIPIELAWRIGFVLAAWVFVMFVCARVWREEDT